MIVRTFASLAAVAFAALTPPAPASAQPGLAVLRPCAASQLQGAVTGTEGATLHVIVTITLTNRGTAACAIDGFPAIRLLDAQRRPRIAAESFGGTPALFTIGPGQKAQFALRIATGDGVTTYPTVPWVAIVPPGDVAPIYLHVTVPSAPTVDVNALVKA